MFKQLITVNLSIV